MEEAGTAIWSGTRSFVNELFISMYFWCLLTAILLGRRFFMRWGVWGEFLRYTSNQIQVSVQL